MSRVARKAGSTKEGKRTFWSPRRKKSDSSFAFFLSRDGRFYSRFCCFSTLAAACSVGHFVVFLRSVICDAVPPGWAFCYVASCEFFLHSAWDLNTVSTRGKSCVIVRTHRLRVGKRLLLFFLVCAAWPCAFVGKVCLEGKKKLFACRHNIIPSFDQTLRLACCTRISSTAQQLRLLVVVVGLLSHRFARGAGGFV